MVLRVLEEFIEKEATEHRLKVGWMDALSHQAKGGEDIFLLCFESVPSTQVVAHRALELVSEGVDGIVLTELQTAGRGRSGRSWVGERGNFFCSFLVRCGVSLGELRGSSVVLGLVVVKVLEEFFKLSSDLLWLKWPNDLVDYGGRKLGGLLVEAEPRGDGTQMVIGVGINLVCAPRGVKGTTCLREVLGEEGEEVFIGEQVPALAWEMFEGFRKLLRDYSQGGIRRFLPQLREKIWGVGKTFTVELGERVVKGISQGISDDGSLYLVNEYGEPYYLTSGHVIDVS
ncbi:MAG: biotin--[acetyl-CoA-carboxylase] ligase [Candidatus Dadabacteria bacterium]|nr:MAG: biotin--[acetyl-CoA-carboxylase] ligase [Candidatus Dadabacteria bacterium]